MGKRPYNEARREANERYAEKTYKNHLFKLRIEEDADILQALEEATAKGITKREWLRELWENQK